MSSYPHVPQEKSVSHSGWKLYYEDEATLSSLAIPLVLLILALSPTASQTIQYDHIPSSYNPTSGILNVPSIVAIISEKSDEPRCTYVYFSFHGEGGRSVNADLVGIRDYVNFYVMNTQQFLSWKRYSLDCSSPSNYIVGVEPVVSYHLSWVIPDNAEYYFLFAHPCCNIAEVRFSASIVASAT